jgi:membrane-associated phospholipid phosphatase
MFSTLPRYFTIASIFTLLLSIVLFVLSAFLGKEAIFLWFNQDLGKAGDLFFSAFTYLAEGWIWIPYFILLFGWFKREASFILYNFLISTLLTQIPKYLIWPNAPRPMGAGIKPNLVHTVSGVEIHLTGSFPSGHSATAFTIYLATLYFFPNKKVLLGGAIYALLCGYSRVYLAQHFPMDVAGGIIVAILSVYSSIYISKLKKYVHKN